MPPAPAGLRSQAREAIRRWRVQGPNGYTGETGRHPYGIAPLAARRELWGALYQAANPFLQDVLPPRDVLGEPPLATALELAPHGP